LIAIGILTVISRKKIYGQFKFFYFIYIEEVFKRGGFLFITLLSRLIHKPQRAQ